ncbi:MAG: hypothetical protein JWQ90_4826 [Hydrocarboniphaga sp.]|nr:hypothetical protein [Hydrocarboniphaga sp.]
MGIVARHGAQMKAADSPQYISCEHWDVLTVGPKGPVLMRPYVRLPDGKDTAPFPNWFSLSLAEADHLMEQLRRLRALRAT